MSFQGIHDFRSVPGGAWHEALGMDPPVNQSRPYFLNLLYISPSRKISFDPLREDRGRNTQPEGLSVFLVPTFYLFKSFPSRLLSSLR